jgi:hypothetical protein
MAASRRYLSNAFVVPDDVPAEQISAHPGMLAMAGKLNGTWGQPRCATPYAYHEKDHDDSPPLFAILVFAYIVLMLFVVFSGRVPMN